jgi:hypothetical protein
VTGRRWVGVFAGCLVLLVAAAYVTARHAPATPVPSAGAVRLGPEPGEDVSAYLARLPATLPPDGPGVLALAQLSAEVPTSDAVALVAGTSPVTAVFRVPVPRVQTALRFVDVEPGVPVATALDSARIRAEQAAAADAGRLPGRAGAVAAAEAAALADPGCRCVLAVLVHGDRAGLAAVAARAGVRAVEAAPPGDADPALAPLLAEQTARADPPPDDGPVPASS